MRNLHQVSNGTQEKVDAFANYRISEAVLARMYRVEAPRPPADVRTVAPMFALMHAKSFRYLRIGPNHYREADLIGLPDPSWTEAGLECIRSGCEQILHWNGIQEDRPIVGIGIEGMYMLMKLFHFRLLRQSVVEMDQDWIIDRMEIEHVVMKEGVWVFNKVPAPPQLS